MELSAGGASVLEIARAGNTGTVALRTGIGGPRSLPLPPPDRRELLAGELELRGHDTAFERALVRATGFAERAATP